MMAEAKENDQETSTKRKKRQRVSSILKNEDRISRLQYEEDYAEGYLRKLSKEVDETLFTEILSVIVKIENNTANVKELFENIVILLRNREDLQWEFLGFLEPYQALECGKLMSYYETCNMKQFVRSLMLHFKRQPHLLKTVIDKLCYLAEKERVHNELVEEEITPFLQKNSVLMQQFLKLLPSEKPPEWYFSSDDVWEDFRIDNEVNDEEIIEISNINETVNVESKNCIYGCKKKNLILCPICDIKFINGRMYIANGRMLRRANIIFDHLEEAEQIKRLVGKSNYFPPLTSRSRSQKRIDVHKETNEGNCSPFLIGTESEEDENDIPRQKRKKRTDSQRLKVRLKTGKRKYPENGTTDQNQADDITFSNDDVSYDDTGKEDNGYNSCDDNTVPACFDAKNSILLGSNNNCDDNTVPAYCNTESGILFGSKEIVHLGDMEFNISAASNANYFKNRPSESHRLPKSSRLNFI